MKLTIELVPKSSYYTNVRSNVSQGEWDKIRREEYQRANYQCEICGVGGRMECHEVWSYENGIQKLERMIVLCHQCHQVKHFGKAKLDGKEAEALAHLMKINNMTLEKAQEYITNSFKQWRQRSKKKWKLDISLIQKEKPE